MQRSPSSSRFVMFPAVPNVDGYTAVGSVAASRQRLAEVIRGGEGVGLLIGPTGTGKSLLCCLLAEALREEFHVVLLADSQLNSGETLLKHILFHLNLPYRDLSEGELRLALIDHLTQGMRGSAKSGLALIIDEAQGLSPKLLEEVRMITNIVRDGEPRVRTILAGSPGLEERLQDPALDSLQQRIASRCYLHPLTCEDAARYIREALAGGSGEASRTIDDEAVRLVHQATGGIPRLINQFMRQTLSLAPTGTLDAALIDRVWQELQQLPSPVTDADVVAKLGDTAVHAEPDAGKTPAATPSASIVEFGLLTPEDDSPEAASDPAKSSESAGETSAAAAIEAASGEQEPIDPVAQADPKLAAELERMTESLQQLADDRSPEPMWMEESETAGAPNFATDGEPDCEPDFAPDYEPNLADWNTREWVIPASTDAVNLQFACVAGDHEAAIPADCGDALEDRERLADMKQLVDTDRIEPIEPIEASIPTIEWTEEAETGEAHTAAKGSLPPVAETVATVLSIVELFGDDFDEEETIPTERNYDRGEAGGVADGAVASTGDRDAAAPQGVEQRLHEELIGLARETAELPTILAPTIASPGSERASEARVSEARPAGERPEAARRAGGAGMSTSEPHDIQLADDSDLLVIEEAVEVEPLRIQAPLFDDDASDSRDYEALFKRLRQGG